MISKEEFLEICKAITRFEDEGRKLTESPVLNQDLMYDVIGFFWVAMEKTLKLIFTDDGIEWIYWWFYEKPYVKGKGIAYDKTGAIIPTETPEDLWNLVSDCIK